LLDIDNGTGLAPGPPDPQLTRPCSKNSFYDLVWHVLIREQGPGPVLAHFALDLQRSFDDRVMQMIFSPAAGGGRCRYRGLNLRSQTAAFAVSTQNTLGNIFGDVFPVQISHCFVSAQHFLVDKGNVQTLGYKQILALNKSHTNPGITVIHRYTSTAPGFQATQAPPWNRAALAAADTITPSLPQTGLAANHAPRRSGARLTLVFPSGPKSRQPGHWRCHCHAACH